MMFERCAVQCSAVHALQCSDSGGRERGKEEGEKLKARDADGNGDGDDSISRIWKGNRVE